MSEPNHPQRIGRLLVLRQLGRGGMGDVLEAYDEDLGRHVAIKSLRRSRRWSATARQRFLREARALSQLEHKNVCRLYDLVRHEGNDYLVMELVDGATLGKLEKKNLTNADKLRIAIDIAQALVAAHQRQLIHRDLKPDNVMLTKKCEVKVLDFGLVRSSSPLSESDGSAFDRSDSYLREHSNTPMDGDTASAPLATPVPVEPSATNGAQRSESEESHSGPLLDSESAPDQETVTLSRIAPRSPTPPISSDATTAGSILGTPAFMSPEQARGEALTTASDAYSFGLLLHFLFSSTSAHPHELSSAEILKRARNNQTLPPTKVRSDVARLIRDLLSSEQERRPSADLALQRLVRMQGRPRRIGLLAAAATLIILLAAGAFKYVRDLDRERQQALAARQDSEQVMRYLTNVFFAAAGREKPLEEISALEMLDGGVRRLREELPKSPRIKAQILAQIGVVYQSLGRYAEAASFQREALETPLGHENLVLQFEIETDLASNLERLGRLPEAENMLRANISAINEDIVDSEEAQRLLRNNRLVLAQVLEKRERFEEAIDMLSQTFDPEAQPGEAWEPTRRLAITLSLAERHDLSRPLFVKAIELVEATFGPESEYLAATLESAAIDLMMVRDLEAARLLAERALKLQEKRLGRNSVHWANSAGNLSNILAQIGDHPQALELAEEARRVFEKGGRGEQLAWAYSLVAGAEEKLDHPINAETGYRRAVESIREEDPKHPRVGQYQRYLGLNLMRQGRFETAEPELLSALKASLERHGPESYRVVSRHESLAELYVSWGKVELAVPHHDRMLQLLPNSPETARPELRESLGEYAVMLEEQGKLDMASTARRVLDQISAVPK